MVEGPTVHFLKIGARYNHLNAVARGKNLVEVIVPDLSTIPPPVFHEIRRSDTWIACRSYSRKIEVLVLATVSYICGVLPRVFKSRRKTFGCVRRCPGCSHGDFLHQNQFNFPTAPYMVHSEFFRSGEVDKQRIGTGSDICVRMLTADFTI